MVIYRIDYPGVSPSDCQLYCTSHDVRFLRDDEIEKLGGPCFGGGGRHHLSSSRLGSINNLRENTVDTRRPHHTMNQARPAGRRVPGMLTPNPTQTHRVVRLTSVM